MSDAPTEAQMAEAEALMPRQVAVDCGAAVYDWTDAARLTVDTLHARDAEIVRLRERVATVEGERDRLRAYLLDAPLAKALEERDAALTRATAAEAEVATMREWADRAAEAENANARELAEIRLAYDTWRADCAANPGEHERVGHVRASWLPFAAAMNGAGTALSALLHTARRGGIHAAHLAIADWLAREAADNAECTDAAPAVVAQLAERLREMAAKYERSDMGAHLPPERPTTTDTDTADKAGETSK
jgi:hypothetical protein